MLVAAAVCPCPPLLVPEVAAGAAPEMDAVRAACARAVAVLAGARPDRLIVVGPAAGEGRTAFPAGATGSFRGFGVDLDVILGTPADGASGAGAGEGDVGPGRVLPLPLAVGAWLLGYAAWSRAPVEGMAVAEDLDAGQCVRTGTEIAAAPERVALLAMGDGSACRTLKAPGYLDQRAAAFDAAVAEALAAADTQALKGVDVELARELKAAGRAPWQVLAGAAEGADLHGTLLHDEAPYGVGYMVAAWS
ncbi:class III extradiol dioxygenase subunit B-like domain-containing protein [Streptomyces sp. TS71-3]|uniref:class III extradiol dioxygenase subunit B-like domain-containing protein n=1 Tax=Streptomyces sp. TS71-3 TaxID=2733862 RepID=UPI001B1E348E|nr:class III extradiol dioxygenase subunit B-like domain-containing protein [Streptomyces sp. TS71-3]GHJ40583.1 hypothetical protein Sm713_61920 [Streptomyces sp. TS71-3]